MLVVPPPMSMMVAPSSRSSGTRLDNPEASGAETISSISRSQRPMQASRLRNEVAVVSMTCRRALRVEQNRPRGSTT